LAFIKYFKLHIKLTVLHPKDLDHICNE